MKIYRLLAIAAVVVSGWAITQLGVALYSGYRSFLPDVTILKTRYPVATLQGDSTSYQFVAKKPAHWRTLRQISRKAVSAVLMSEDAGFYSHRGYEPEAIRAAWISNQKPGTKIIRGGSTITQQMVKNVFLTKEKTITRKVRELLLAIDVENTFSKPQILETYLNIAEWGRGIYGIEQASHHYFRKSSADLTAREGAILAFLLPNPVKYSGSIRGGELTSFASARVESILERLWRTGHIDNDEYALSLFGEAVSL